MDVAVTHRGHSITQSHSGWLIHGAAQRSWNWRFFNTAAWMNPQMCSKVLHDCERTYQLHLCCVAHAEHKTQQGLSWQLQDPWRIMFCGGTLEEHLWVTTFDPIYKNQWTKAQNKLQPSKNWTPNSCCLSTKLFSTPLSISFYCSNKSLCYLLFVSAPWQDSCFHHQCSGFYSHIHHFVVSVPEKKLQYYITTFNQTGFKQQFVPVK